MEGEEEAGGGEHGEGAGKEGEAGGATVQVIDNLVLNPAASGGTRFLLLTVAFDMKTPALAEQLKARDAEVRAGGTSCLLLVCLPFAVLDKFFATSEQRHVNVGTGSEREREQSRELTEAQVRVTRVPVAARLPEFRMSMHALGNLAVGGVVSTGIPRDATIHVRVGTQERFRATAGRVGRNLALRVIDAPAAPDDPAPRPHC